MPSVGTNAKMLACEGARANPPASITRLTLSVKCWWTKRRDKPRDSELMSIKRLPIGSIRQVRYHIGAAGRAMSDSCKRGLVRAQRSVDLEGFNLDVKCHVHFEAVLLANGNAVVRAVNDTDGISATNAF